MFKLNIGVLALALTIGGCASKIEKPEYSGLSVTHNEMNSNKWSQLKRFQARYPIQTVKKSIEGCATIEYVVTPENEIKDITVISSTNRYFSKAAKDVIQNWNWSELPHGIVSKPVKTQTRFDFCFDKPNKSCAEIKPAYSCPGEDIIFSTGSIIKVGR